MGGWHLQPDCNMPSGEALIRQILSGRKYFSEKYGISPSVTINFDSFGHSRGLVQIVTKTGYDSYMCCRPSDWWISLPSDMFIWKGYDGSEVTVRRLDAYSTPLGHAQDKRLAAERYVGFCDLKRRRAEAAAARGAAAGQRADALPARGAARRKAGA